MFFEIMADCGGEEPFVDCPCCSHCCDRITGECEVQQELLGEVVNHHFTSPNGYFYDDAKGAVCACDVKEESVEQHCFDTQCLICNKEETICAQSIDYGLILSDNAYYDGVHNKFQYVVGRNDTVTFKSDYSNPVDAKCSVSVNNQDCSFCQLLRCGDGFMGYEIRCENIEGAGNFNSCDDHHDVGPLSVFAAHDPLLGNGCSPFLAHILLD